MTNPEKLTHILKTRLHDLYGGQAEIALDLIRQKLPDSIPTEDVHAEQTLWDETDVVLITYGGQLQQQGFAPLETLSTFLKQSGLIDLINNVHFLPFFPYSSDDGFSVIDYRTIDPELGTWKNVELFREHYSLMFDLVLNHASQQSEWFQKYLAGEEPYTGFFYECDPEADVSAVTRPRSHPLLTPFETANGIKHLWTTFSDDQIDLNFANPQLLAEMLDVMLFYVERGARIIRLDAIAYLWKEQGTPCIHLPQVHTVVKLMRDLLDVYAPRTILLTETNVPHKENVSYFGEGDEARMVYQFSLAPLLLDAFLTQDTQPLLNWLTNLEATKPGNTYFNFTASHDGIGVRPLEGLVPQVRIDNLVEAVRQRGGEVSYKRNSDGTESPYELNITWFSAMNEPDGLDETLHVRRFLSSQAFMLALRGIPGIYFHSIVGTPNDYAGMQQTGRARSINRQTFQLADLQQTIEDSTSAQSKVFSGYQQLLKARISQPALHPDANQQVVNFHNPRLAAFLRISCDDSERLLVIINTGNDDYLNLEEFDLSGFSFDLISESSIDATNLYLPQYGAVWLSNRVG